ncbi:MAG: sugar ABC transporter substrate-binding protein [Ignavibacteria bacterium]|nr:sugar ABC transporter substrate-binding protein [Ignavibacteria bacterium]
MKRTAFIAFLLSISFFSCGKKSGVVELQNWNFGGRPKLIEFLRQRVYSFEKIHPAISVTNSDKSWNMIREILYADFSAGAGPDVMNTHSNFAAEFGEAGFYYPINKFPDFEQVKQWYVPHLLESTRYKDNYYGLPSSAIAFVLCCNKELFDGEGLTPPKTWSQFREAAKRLTKDADGDGEVDQYGLVLMGGDKGGFAYRMIPFFFKAGVNVMSEDLTKIEFNAPMGVAALKLMADMYQIDHSITPGFLAYTHSEINDLFCSNKAAMSIEGPWFRGMVDDKSPGKDMYVVPVPVPDNMITQYDTAPTLQDMVMYSINAHSKHLNEAWELLKHLRNEEADMFWITQDLGATATTKHALSSSEAQNVKDIQLYINELNHARPWPPHPSMVAIVSNVFTPYCQKAIVGELTPNAALDQAAKEAQEIIDEKK